MKLFERFENDEITFAVSDLLDLELLDAPQRVRKLLSKYSPDKLERIELTKEAIKLTNIYIKQRVMRNFW